MRRWVKHTLVGAGLSVVFTGALLAAVALHANLPGFRRAGAEIANRSMAPVFDGKIVVGSIDRLEIGSKSRAVVHSATIYDPDGNRVIDASGIDATINLKSLLRSIWSGRGPAVELENVRVETANVALDRGPDGKPLLAKALHPKASASKPATPEAKPSAPTTSSEPYLDIASVRLAHAKVHGNMVPPKLDGETEAVLGRVHLEHQEVRINVDEGKATLRSPQAPNQKEPIIGDVKGVLSFDIKQQSMSGHADFDGSVGPVPVTARAKIDGDLVDATVDVARVEVAPLGKAFGSLPFGRPVEVHAHAHGALPIVQVDLRGRVGESDLTGTGNIDLREGHSFALSLEAQHADASAYGAPVATDITTKVKVSGSIAGKGRLGVTGLYTIETQPGTVANEKLPAATITGEIKEETLTAVLVTKDEPGLELGGTASMELGTFVTDFDVSASSKNLRSASRIPAKVDGSATARVQGKVNVLAGTIDAKTSVHGDGLAFDSFRAAHLDVSGTLRGPLNAPVLDASFTGKDMQVKAKDKKPLIYPSASGRAQVAFVPTVSIVSASVDLGEKGSPNAIGASAAHVSVVNGTVEARGVQLTGLGEPLELDANFGKGSWRLRAKSAGVDLQRVAAATGIKGVPEGTRAALDVDIHDGDGGATGHADVVVTSEPGKILGGGVKLETHATIERGHLTGTAKVSSPGLGEVEIASAELDIPGRLDQRSLERTTGVIELRGSLDLSQGGALLGGDKIEQMSGMAYFEGRIERGDPQALPAVRATVKTAGLDIMYSEDPAKPSVHVGGIDLALHADWDGRTNDTELAFLSWDHAGLLGNAAAKAKVPLADWVTGAQKLTGRSIADLNIGVVADVPLRNVSDLPAFLGLPELRGKVGAHVAIDGQVIHPTVLVSARAEGLRAENRRAAGGPRGASSFEPTDGILEARWNGERGAITFALDERAPPPTDRTPPPIGLPAEPRRRVKRAPGHVHGLVTFTDARMADLLRGRSPMDLPWSASTEIDVQDLNLGAIPIPASSMTRQITGALTGRFKIRDLNRDASFEANATVADFGVGGAVVDTLTVTAGGRDSSLFVNARMKDADSQATFQLASQSPTVKGLDVDWDKDKPSRLDYAVQNVQIGLFLPLVRRSVSEMEGRINGAGSVTLDGASQVFEGGLALSQTNMYVNVLGEQISGLTATARFERSGVFSISDAAGKLGSGEFKATAQGKMKGFQFESAEATVTATKEGIPISSEGATFASAAGEVDIQAAMSADRSALEVKLEVPHADISLPERSTQQLQSLDADKTIDIGVRRHDGKLDTTAVRRGRGGTGKQTTATATTSATFTTKLEATLGPKVRLEGRGMDVTLGGKTYIQIANELAVTGQIDLRGGTIEVHGRRFTVDRGIITFPEGGDPTNPSIVAAAYWDAPDRTRVWVDFTGPIKSGTLTLRSEPAYSKNEILSILLFGQPDPNMASGSGGTGGTGGDASGATAVGTGFVAEDINRMLSEIDSNLNYETDTLSGNRARTKLGRSFFDQRLKVQIGYAPGYTYREPDTTYLLLNWQFIPKWSIVGTRGDKGTSIVDVLWQHRY
jgi:translocation and assembly module TamB